MKCSNGCGTELDSAGLEYSAPPLVHTAERCWLASTQVAETMNGLRCRVTKNPCGTDTWMKWVPCKCISCQEWLCRSHEHALIRALRAEELIALIKNRESQAEKVNETLHKQVQQLRELLERVQPHMLGDYENLFRREHWRAGSVGGVIRDIEKALEPLPRLTPEFAQEQWDNAISDLKSKGLDTDALIAEAARNLPEKLPVSSFESSCPVHRRTKPKGESCVFCEAGVKVKP
jgi:hypothetical protein